MPPFFIFSKGMENRVHFFESTEFRKSDFSQYASCFVDIRSEMFFFVAVAAYRYYPAAEFAVKT